MIKGWTTPKIYLKFFKSGEEIPLHPVNISGQNFDLCSPIAYNDTHSISFSNGSGSWDLHAYDDEYDDLKIEPAVKLHNISINLMRKETTLTDLHVPSAATETSASTSKNVIIH